MEKAEKRTVLKARFLKRHNQRVKDYDDCFWEDHLRAVRSKLVVGRYRSDAALAIKR